MQANQIPDLSDEYMAMIVGKTHQLMKYNWKVNQVVDQLAINQLTKRYCQMNAVSTKSKYIEKARLVSD